MKKKFLIVVAFVMGVFIVNAQVAAPNQKSEAKRIKKGVKSGELTKGETKKLVQEQREIREEKRDARADGVVTTAERREIKKDERKASRHIYIAKHNRRDRN